jgi:hypothetical protein
MDIPRALNELSRLRTLYATYAADEQAVLSGWAAHIYTQWKCLYRAIHWNQKWNRS